MLHLFIVIYLSNLISSLFFLSLVFHETSFFIICTLLTELVLVKSILVISCSSFHYLISLAFGLLDFLPSFLFFKFEEGYSVGKKLSIFGRLFLILSGCYESSSNFLCIIEFVSSVVIIILLLFVHLLLIIQWVLLG